MGVFPPSSKPTRLRFSDAFALIVFPVAVLPVKLMTGTSGERTSTSPVTWPPVMTMVLHEYAHRTVVWRVVREVAPGALVPLVQQLRHRDRAHRIPRARDERTGVSPGSYRRMSICAP